jgi:hypothetical protein
MASSRGTVKETRVARSNALYYELDVAPLHHLTHTTYGFQKEHVQRSAQRFICQICHMKNMSYEVVTHEIRINSDLLPVLQHIG